MWSLVKLREMSKKVAGFVLPMTGDQEDLSEE
jgi:hypothetical protein